MHAPATDPTPDRRAGSFDPPSARAAALLPLALAPYDELRGLCRDLEAKALPDEHVVLAALAGFLAGHGCHYASLTCQTAQRRPDLRPDLHGLYARLAAFQDYLRGIAGVTDDEARRADEADRQADRFEFSVSDVRDVSAEAGTLTRAQACERWPDLAALLQWGDLVGLSVDFGNDRLTVELAGTG